MACVIPAINSTYCENSGALKTSLGQYAPEDFAAARMLAGSHIAEEARAAAERLLNGH